MVISIITAKRERERKKKYVRGKTVIGFSPLEEREQERGSLSLYVFLYVMLGCRLNDFE